jgi:hypothetical protein
MKGWTCALSLCGFVVEPSGACVEDVGSGVEEDSALNARRQMELPPCVISAADHAGWAHLVCVAAPDRVPVVVERRRVTLIDAGLPALPYHHESLGMREDEANALIARVRRSIAACTARALRRTVADLAPAYRVVALAIREPPFTELPESVVAVRRSYQLQCAADGMMYQLGLCRAARDLGLDVHLCRRGEETGRAAARLEVHSDRIDSFVSGKGRPPGPPWTREHRRAYAAGIAALAAHTPRPRKIQIP